MKEPYELPDEQCERLKRMEQQACQMLLVCVSSMRYVREDLKDRLECVPSGTQRMNMLIGQIESLTRDIMGTVSDKQRYHLQNIVKDMENRLMPKFTPTNTSVVMTKDEAKMLVDAAQEHCIPCMKDCEECRSCKLYNLMTAIVPLDNYDSTMCPYSNTHKEWEN